jgi:hypothetical protein
MITSGRGRGVVVATGGDTAIGKIRDAMSDQGESLTPLKQKLEEFGSLLSKVIAAICVLVWVGGAAGMAEFAAAVCLDLCCCHGLLLRADGTCIAVWCYSSSSSARPGPHVSLKYSENARHFPPNACSISHPAKLHCPNYPTSPCPTAAPQLPHSCSSCPPVPAHNMTQSARCLPHTCSHT